MTQLSREAQNLNWLVSNFAKSVPGAAHAIVLSADGLLMAVSDRLDRARRHVPGLQYQHRPRCQGSSHDYPTRT